MTDSVFRLHVLPAGIGDALVIEYGEPGATRRVLVDGGTARSAEALGEFLGPAAPLELLVITHIDNDHIAGALKLLNQPTPPAPKELWFNGYRHLPESAAEAMGPVEGEKLTTLIVDRGYRWNDAFGGGAVMTGSGAPAPPPRDGGLELTVLSPGLDQLRALRQRSTWTEVVRAADLDPHVAAPVEPEPAPSGLERMGAPNVVRLAAERSTDDNAPANGSSIALLVTYAERRCLLAGDAHPKVLAAGIEALVGRDGVLEVDVFKLPHHGSKANVSVDLLRRVRAHTYVFSTDGSGRQRHPNDQAVARVIVGSGTSPLLVFNYRSAHNEVWGDPGLLAAHGYRAWHPDPGTAGVTVDLVRGGCSPLGIPLR